MADVRLVYPSKEYEKKAFEYIQEFIEYKSEIHATGGLDRYDNYDEWLLKVEKDTDIPNIIEDRVPSNTYFFVRVSDDKIIGMINIRHRLNEFLFNEGGHIGYSIRPTERKKGYATLMLSLGLQKCRELNMDRVLIICDKVNEPSAKVTKNNNGVLEKEVYSDWWSQIIQRYWINL
jgi:predicted acetyltransferase